MRLPFRLLAAIAALAFVGAGCVPVAVPTSSGGSGVSGHVTLGPTCPVERIPPDPNCAPRPYQASLVVKTAGGTDVATVMADASGSYAVSLSPGSYAIGPASGAPKLPRGETKTFVVQAGQVTTVDLSYDSGIR